MGSDTPTEISINVNTLKRLMPQWARNIAYNVQFNGPNIRSKKDLLELDRDFGRNKKRVSICVGAGPSLKKYDHLKKLKEFQKKFDGLVLACDRSLPMCLEAGVIPDIVSSLDGDPSIKKYFDSELVRKHSKDIKGVFSVTCHPDVIDSWKGDSYFFVPILDVYSELDSTTRFMRLLTGKTMMSHGGNVGMLNWFSSITPLYCNPVVLLGMEFSWPMPIDIRETETFDAHNSNANGDMEKIEKSYWKDYNPDFKNEALVDVVMDEYIREAKRVMPLVNQAYGTKTINCTGGGTLHSISGMESMDFEAFVQKFDCGEFANLAPPKNAVALLTEEFFDKKENVVDEQFYASTRAIQERQS